MIVDDTSVIMSGYPRNCGNPEMRGIVLAAVVVQWNKVGYGSRSKTRLNNHQELAQQIHPNSDGMFSLLAGVYSSSSSSLSPCPSPALEDVARKKGHYQSFLASMRMVLEKAGNGVQSGRISEVSLWWDPVV